ncbi:MAG: hypothetical protein HOP97_04495 [Terrabacter sp.]|nr:hypothetical protein [Terrabacter sp.]
MTTTIRPTRQAVRRHMSHLATTHRAPLVSRPHEDAGIAPRTPGGRPRATAFTPMAPDGVDREKPRHQVHTQLQSQTLAHTQSSTQES